MTRKRRELTEMTMPPGVPKRWRKKHQGKILYFRGSCEEALKQWHKKQTELEREQEEEKPGWHRKMTESIRQWYLSQGDQEAADRLGDDLRKKDEDLLGKDWDYLSDAAKSVWVDRIRIMTQKPTNEPHTVHQAVESFLAQQRVRVDAKDITAGYYDLMQRSINDFADHVGRRVSVNNITGHMLVSFRTELMKRKEWTADYAAGRMRNVITFVNWCYDTELLDKLPRVLRRGNKSLRIATGEKKKPNFTNDEVKILLDNASERTQLYLLLMANTGCTQIDLSELRPDQVDWKTGKVTRKRSKTEDKENVPEVSYPLWSRTFELLKKFGSRKGNHVLTNERGGELKREGLDGARLTKCDNVATAYGRLARKLTKKRKDGKPPLMKKVKPLKTFRKTSPSRLEDSEFATCVRWFGGWSPKSVADKNYIRPPRELFDRAVRWLAKSYGLEK